MVEEVGPGVTRLKPGDHVVMAFMPACGHCRWCASGVSVLCDYGAVIMAGLPIADGKPRVARPGSGPDADVAARHVQPVRGRPPGLVREDRRRHPAGAGRRWSAAASPPASAPRSTGRRSGRATPSSSSAPAASGRAPCRAPGSPAPRYIVAVDPIEFRREQAKLLGATHAVASMDEAMPLVTRAHPRRDGRQDDPDRQPGHGDMLKPLMLLTRKGGRACLTSTANPNIDQRRPGPGRRDLRAEGDRRQRVRRAATRTPTCRACCRSTAAASSSSRSS